MENTLAATPKARLAASAVPAVATRRRELPPTVLVRAVSSRSPIASGLDGVASWVEKMPMPELPDSAWRFLAGAWFFIAGTTMGVLFAVALIAVYGKPSPARPQPAVVSSVNGARALVIEKPATMPERGMGEVAMNDVEEAAPLPAPKPAARRVAVAPRKPSSSRRPNAGDILSAGL